MAEMYLYNGVKLPKIPDEPVYDNQNYSKIFVTYEGPGWPGHYRVFYGDVKAHHYSDGGLYMNGICQFSYIDGMDIETDGWEYVRFVSGAGITIPVSCIIWSNFDLTDDKGNIIIADSDPVSVLPTDPAPVLSHSATALVQGWLAGKRLAGMRGRVGEIVSTTSELGAAVLGRMILGG